MSLKMKKIVFVLLLMLPSFSINAQEKLPKLIKKIQPSVVSIITYDKDGEPLSSGSGFFINKEGHIITNCHVMKDAWSAEVKTYDGATYKVSKVLAHNFKSDIVLLSLKTYSKKKPVRITSVLPDIGSSVFVIGNPKGLEHTVSDGIVSSVRIDSDYGKVIQITAPISPGSSGSPVMNMKGEVIGVATFQYIEGQNLNFSIPCLIIKQLKPIENFSLEKWQEIKEYDADGILLVLLSEGEKYILEENFSDALKAFKAVEEQMPDVPEVSYLLGYCYQNLNEEKKSYNSYSRAIKLNENYGYAYFGLAELNFDKQKYKKTISLCDETLLTLKEYSDAYMLRGSAKEKLGNLDGAELDYSIAKRIKAKNRFIDKANLIRKSLLRNKVNTNFNLGIKLKAIIRQNKYIEAAKKQ